MAGGDYGTYRLAKKYDVWFHEATTKTTFRDRFLFHCSFHFIVIEWSFAVDASLASKTTVSFNDSMARQAGFAF